MTAQVHIGSRANYLNLTLDQIELLTNPNGRENEYSELVTRFKSNVCLNNTCFVLDAQILDQHNFNGGVAKLIHELSQIGYSKVPILYSNLNITTPLQSFSCPIFETVRLSMYLMDMPFAYSTMDYINEKVECHIVGTNSMAVSHRSVILEIYKHFKMGQEFTTADLIEFMPVPGGKILSTHSSSIGNALKTICTKYPNLLCFESRMVRNDDPKKRNQNTFFYRIPNPLPIGTSKTVSEV